MAYPQAAIKKVRCLRCGREIEMTSTDEDAVVFISYNLQYCNGCAEITGHPGRPSARVRKPEAVASSSTSPARTLSG
ncbi:hypothetical protein QL093DRAFT_2527063 [Fusarium oxysporum]|nr:hypothetical protein QL093DRAFT_2527063 [Fusarium oxysporum]